MHLLTKIPPTILARLGLETAVAVTMQMDSGDRLRFTAKRVHVDMEPLGPLKSVRWAGEHGAPVFYDPARVESVRCFETVRWAEPPRLQPQAVDQPQDMAPVPALHDLIRQAREQAESEPLELTEVFAPDEGFVEPAPPPTTAEDVHAAFKAHGVHETVDQLASVLAAA